MSAIALHDPALRDPTVDRLLPVDEAFAPALPGLQRGRVVGCTGPAAVSLALALTARAVVSGSWLALVGMPMLGPEAAAEMGIPLRRLVHVDVDGGPSVWAERVAAVADGFELIVTRPPNGAERMVRKVRQRLQARGAVLVVTGPTAPGVSCDVEVATDRIEWSGLGAGVGHLRARRVVAVARGRRMPRPITLELWLPGPDGRVAPASRDPAVDGADVDGADVDGTDEAVWSRAG